MCPNRESYITRSNTLFPFRFFLSLSPLRVCAPRDPRPPHQEYDHLDGVVYIDHLDENSRIEVQPRLDELISDFGEDGEL